MGILKLGFKQADIIIENTYYTPLVEHAFMETEGAVAYLDEDGVMVVYSSCQAPHRDQIQIARALGVPENKVRVITPHIGGAFGGKDEAHVQIHAALLAQASGRPVSIIRSREESILTHVKRHPVIIRYRTGITRDGKLTAVHAEAIGDTGPYLNAGRDVMNFVAATLSGPYYVPNARLEAYTVFTNNPICGAMRGYGIPQASFAYEAHMDAPGTPHWHGSTGDSLAQRFGDRDAGSHRRDHPGRTRYESLPAGSRPALRLEGTPQ